MFAPVGTRARQMRFFLPIQVRLVKVPVSGKAGPGRENPARSGLALTATVPPLDHEVGEAAADKIGRMRLKVVAVVSVRLLNSPATLGNQGGGLFPG